MATDARRNVKLTVTTETPGAEKLGGLAADLRDMAAAGGEAAPKFEALAADLDRAATATKAARDAERSATTERTAARAALDQQRDALARMRAESTTATRSTEAFQAAERAAKLALIEARAAVRDKAAALATATAESRAAVAAEKALADAALATAAAFRAGSTETVSGATAVSSQLDKIKGQLESLRNVAALALGGSLVGGLARDIAQTAEAYTSLSARVKIATDGNADFKASLDEVYAIAQRTGIGADEVGASFLKLATAGKQLGVSTADALRLTESLSQALVIGGASAQEAASAQLQFAQAIGSGVLQGDELKSLLEASPRLARALADGLGVAVGKLKELGAAGALSSQQVIAALQGQAAALESEFGQLPLTLSRAVANLGTAWQQYLGQVNEARGVTSSIAGAIDAVSKNLDTLVSLLYSAGKAAAALAVVNLARSWLESASAIGAAANATRAATAATTAHTLAATANAAAVTAQAAATAGAVGSVGRFAALLSTLKVGALVTVLVNVKELGTALGEGLARLVGYGKGLDDLERSAKAQADATRLQAQQTAAFAQAAQQASDKALGLNDASRKLISEFDGLRQKGETAAEALAKLSKALDLGSVQGIVNAGAALDKLGLQGKLAGDEIRAALSAALDGKDLGVFAANAKAAFDGSTQGARRLAAALDAVADESLRRVGSSARELASGFSESMARAINDTDALIDTLDRLGVKGAEAGRLLATSLDKALQAAGTEAAVRAVIARVEDLGRQGKLTGDALAAALEKARAKLAELQPGVNSVTEAFRTLGIKAPEELARVAAASAEAWQRIKNDGTVALADKQRAFTQYAQTITALADSEAAALVRIQGEALGLSVTFDASGKAIVKALSEAGEAVDGLRGRMRRLRDEAEATAGSLSSVFDAETKGRSDRIDAAQAKNATKYDDQGFRQDASGGRLTEGGQLQPPDDSGDWTFVQRTDYRAYQEAESGAYVVPGVGYWKRKSGGRSITGTSTAPAGSSASGSALSAAATPTASTAPAPVFNVNVTLGSRRTTIATASAADQSALAALLQELETAADRGG